MHASLNFTSGIRNMISSEKRRKQWRDAQQTRRKKLVDAKTHDVALYRKARIRINRNKRKLRAKKSPSTPTQALRRYLRLLRMFHKNRFEILRRIRNTRFHDLDRAIAKASRNEKVQKLLDQFSEFIELQRNNTFVHDDYFEAYNLMFKGKNIDVYIPSAIPDADGSKYFHDFGNHGPGRCPLLLDVDMKVLYYWSRKTITHEKVTMINVRQVPPNDSNDWGTMTLYDYLCQESKPYFNYAHLNYVWLSLRHRLYKTAQYHNEALVLKIKSEYEPYEKDHHSGKLPKEERI